MKTLKCLMLILGLSSVVFAYAQTAPTVYVKVGQEITLEGNQCCTIWTKDNSCIEITPDKNTCVVKGKSAGKTKLTLSGSDKKTCPTDQEWEIITFDVKIVPSACDGVETEILQIVFVGTTTGASAIKNVQLEATNDSGGTTYTNMENKGIIFEGNDHKIKVKQVNWYEKTPNSCEKSAVYKIKGTFELNNQSYNIEESNFTVNADGSCVNGSSKVLPDWTDGDPVIIIGEFIDGNGKTKYYASFPPNKSGLTRSLKTTSNTNNTNKDSQFKESVEKEEAYHVNQFNGLGGIINSTEHWVIQKVYEKVENQMTNGKIYGDSPDEVIGEITKLINKEIVNEDTRTGLLIWGTKENPYTSIRCDMEKKAKSALKQKYILRFDCAYGSVCTTN